MLWSSSDALGCSSHCTSTGQGTRLLVYICKTVYVYCIAGRWAPNHHCKNIGGFKFGGSVRDRHTYMHASMKYWRILIWQLQRQTTKPPNFPAIRYMCIWDTVQDRKSDHFPSCLSRFPSFRYRGLMQLRKLRNRTPVLAELGEIQMYFKL